MGLRCRQQVDRPYPRWGGSRFVEVDHRKSPLHLLWRPVERAQAALLLVHGMNEYVGRYRPVADHFARRFHLAGVDLHGHGLTNPVLRRADEAVRQGARCYDASDAFLEQAALGTLAPMKADFRAALAFVRRRWRGPVFVLAHSLGGLVAASVVLEDRTPLAGVLLPGPAFAVSRLPGWFGRLANPVIDLSFRLFKDCLGRRRFPACLAAAPIEAVAELASLPRLRRLLTPCRPSWVLDCLTDWEEEKERLRRDPYILPRTLLRWVLAIEKEIVRFRARMAAFPVPYYLLYCERDPITAAWGNEDFAAATRANHPDNRVRSLPLPYHEQLFLRPPQVARLLADMDAWLDRRLEMV